MRKNILRVSSLVLVVRCGGLYLSRLARPRAAAASPRCSGRTPQIDPPRSQIVPTIEVADAVGWKARRGPDPRRRPDGQAVRAAGLDHPRWLYRLPNGDVLVAETNSPPREGGGITGWVMGYLMNKAGAGVPSANRITLLRDANGDGVAESRSVLLTGPQLALRHGADGRPALRRRHRRAGARSVHAGPDQDHRQARTVVKLPGGGNHWARNISSPTTARACTLTVGSSTNIAENGIDAENIRANILQVYPRQDAFASTPPACATPTAWRSSRTPTQLWTAVNERDMLGSDLAPDYLTQVEAGDHFGWPWYYWGGYPDHRVEARKPGAAAIFEAPRLCAGAARRRARPGLRRRFASSAAGSANGAFVGEHGSWNRQPVSGYKVVYVPFGDNGFPAADAKPVDVLTGFLDKDGNARGRPVGVIADATGRCWSRTMSAT